MATVQGRRRARNLAEMADIQARVMDIEDIIRSVSGFRPRPTDVIISPAGKCGTTLLQQTFHTLRTHGDMDFDDISRVVPWIETSAALGAISFEEMFAERKKALGKGRDHWSHLTGWWEQRDNPDVLLLSYEHMVDDPERNVRRVAEFCSLHLDDELLELTMEHTSREFMLRYRDRFDDAMLRELSETKGGLPPGSDSAKVRPEGAEKRGLELPRAISEEIDDIWQRDVTPKIGFADFAELEAELRSL